MQCSKFVSYAMLLSRLNEESLPNYLVELMPTGRCICFENEYREHIEKKSKKPWQEKS